MLNKTFAKLKLGRSAVIIFGFILHLTAFSLIYINLPNNASYGETADPAIIQSRYKLWYPYFIILKNSLVVKVIFIFCVMNNMAFLHSLLVSNFKFINQDVVMMSLYYFNKLLTNSRSLKQLVSMYQCFVINYMEKVN